MGADNGGGYKMEVDNGGGYKMGADNGGGYKMEADIKWGRVMEADIFSEAVRRIFFATRRQTIGRWTVIQQAMMVITMEYTSLLPGNIFTSHIIWH
jgi:hypothetical protein